MVDRKKENAKLPPRVYKDRSRYYYRPYLGREDGKPRYGKFIRLCGLDASLAEVWAAYESVVNEDKNSLDWLVGEYMASEQHKELAGKTQLEYQSYSRIILDFPLVNGRRFGEAPVTKINKRVIRGYLDAYPAKVAANRHVEFLSAVFGWGSERFAIVKFNPCQGVKKNKEESRDRYIEDWEYAVTYACALSMRTPIFAPAMEISYLCRARRDEAFSLTSKNLRSEGVWLKRSKGSTDEITLWSDRLKEATDAAKRINTKAPTPLNAPRYIMRRKDGGKYTKNALDSAWQRVIKKAKEVGAELPVELLEDAKRDGARISGNRAFIDGGFTFHDIKAKGCSDCDHGFSGHKSERMKGVYMRLPTKVEATK
jgi:integrase